MNVVEGLHGAEVDRRRFGQENDFRRQPLQIAADQLGLAGGVEITGLHSEVVTAEFHLDQRRQGGVRLIALAEADDSLDKIQIAHCDHNLAVVLQGNSQGSCQWRISALMDSAARG